jgi:1,4-dihydroxy-2-naphthoate octaprenyltransferase
LYAEKEKITVYNLFDRDTILHLRLPFSFFLLPVFWFGISQAEHINIVTAAIVFIALHFFIYPGSNIYNSYMDKDTGSIGGLKHPPPVTRRLYYASIVVDVAGLAICAIAGWKLMLVMAGYVAFSKAYSWEGIRLKKYGYLAWASVMFFQGGYTYMLANMAAENQVDFAWFTAQHLESMLFASLVIGGFYPLTQIYQHTEDSVRGDLTISYKLGIRGTFIFAIVLFLGGCAVALHYFREYHRISHFYIFIICLAPVIIYFLYWFVKTLRNPAAADYNHSMLMTRISSVCMVSCFTVIMLMNNGFFK